MDRLTALRVFVEIADRGSISAAAQALDMSRAMASRYLEHLEHWLGMRVFHRTTRRISLSEAGVEALERCRHMLALEAEVETVAGLRRTTPSGRLRMTASVTLSQSWLAAAVARFVAQYPQAQVELHNSEAAVDLVEGRIDLAVRISDHLDPGLVARSFGVCRSALCAAPSYVAQRGLPREPGQLAEHLAIMHAHVSREEFKLMRDGKTFRVPLRGSILTNETTVAWQAALSGAGIAMLPLCLVHEDLRAGRLLRVLPDYEPQTYGFHAIYLSRRFQPQLLRLMVDHLVADFATVCPQWDAC